MSAQGSPGAPGPRPPQRGRASARASPLWRTSDRIEFWLCRLLLVVLLLGAPVAALGAGVSAYESAARTAAVQSAQRHQVTAEVTGPADGPPGRAGDEEQRVRVRWTEGGERQTGTASVPQDDAGHPTVRIWVDEDGTVRDAPLSAEAAAGAGVLVAGMTAMMTVLVMCAARGAVRLVLDRRRYARWDSEWALVEPDWTERFRM